MELGDNVYYKQFGKYTYIRHVEQANDYLLNETAFDILNYIDRNKGCSKEDVVCCLCSIYQPLNFERFREEVYTFLDDLLDRDIIKVPIKEKQEDSDHVRDVIQEYCCEHHLLYSVCLELTYRCNERCIHCYVDDPSVASMELRLPDYEHIIDQLSDMGCMSILLTGGEPTLHQDFISILEYAKSKGIVVDIYTNGFNISDQVFEKIVASKPNSVSFSLYGGTSEIHDSITGISGSFEKSKNTMMAFKCAGIDTYIKTVIMKQNYKDYEELLKLAKRLRIAIVSAFTVMPTHLGKFPDKFRLMDIDLYKEIIELEYKYGVIDPNQIVHERSDHVCTCGLSVLSIDPYGNIHPCNAHPSIIGNIKTASIQDVWEESEKLREISKFRFRDIDNRCYSCADINWCGLCLGTALREVGRVSPCADTCMLAKAGHETYQKNRTV